METSPIAYGPELERSYLTSGLDYYKPTMSQLAYEQEPDAEVTFTLKNRGEQQLVEYIEPDQLQDRLDTIRQRGFNQAELDYMAGLTNSQGQRVFEQSFLDHIAEKPLPHAEVTVEDGDIAVHSTGEWSMVTFWETVVMSEVNELYFENYVTKNGLDIFEVYDEGDKRLSEKIATLQENPDIKIVDFGTRRHFSHRWQRHVVERLVTECPDNMLGTSNVALAGALDIKPIGTFAHEMPMVYAGLADSRGQDIQASHHQFLEDWHDRYGQDLSTALTDTFTTDFFFADFTPEQAQQWRALRHDSGDPVEFGERAIAFYKQHGIDPTTKSIVFSDGLDMEEIVKLHAHFKDQIGVAFGWGTTLTNDLGIQPLNIVMKATKVNNTPTVKLSDNPGKHTGPADKIDQYQQLFPESALAHAIRRGSIDVLSKNVQTQTYPGYPVYEQRLQAADLSRDTEGRLAIPVGRAWVHPRDMADTSYRHMDFSGYQQDAAGRPLHPWVQDMLDSGAGIVAGKGAYWHWGPNYTADPIIVRHDLEEPHVLLIQRSDTGAWALPGGFVDPGETGMLAAFREAGEEAGDDIKVALSRRGVEARLVYQGPVADLRATAHAWPETTAVRFDIPNYVAREHLLDMQWEGSDDATHAAWVPASEINNRLYGSHRFLIEAALNV